MKGSKRKNKRYLSLMVLAYTSGDTYPYYCKYCKNGVAGVFNDLRRLIDQGYLFRKRNSDKLGITPKGRVLLAKCKMLK